MSESSQTRKRRPRGEGACHWSEKRQRWVAETTVGYNAKGRPIVRTGIGKTEAAALRSMRKKVAEYEAGLLPDSRRITVGQIMEDWLDNGQGRRAGDSTRAKNRALCERHIIEPIGGQKVARLTLAQVDGWLEGRAEVLADDSLRQVRRCLVNALRRAVAQGFAEHKAILVVETAQMPKGQPGRPSKSLTLQQAKAIVCLSEGHPMHPYIVVSLLTGLRTEEVRGLRWDHVHLDTDPPQVWVWRSDRIGGDTKTVKSKRTLALPRQVVSVLREHRTEQARQRLAAGTNWDDRDFVFTTRSGTCLDASNVRRGFRHALQHVVTADLRMQRARLEPDASEDALTPVLDASDWTPRELRHSFVSLLSESEVPVEEIARLVGHKGGSRVTELIYRKELRPVLEKGATAMDQIFATGEESRGA